MVWNVSKTQQYQRKFPNCMKLCLNEWLISKYGSICQNVCYDFSVFCNDSQKYTITIVLYYYSLRTDFWKEHFCWNIFHNINVRIDHCLWRYIQYMYIFCGLLGNITILSILWCSHVWQAFVTIWRTWEIGFYYFIFMHIKWIKHIIISHFIVIFVISFWPKLGQLNCYCHIYD